MLEIVRDKKAEFPASLGFVPLYPSGIYTCEQPAVIPSPSRPRSRDFPNEELGLGVTCVATANFWHVDTTMVVSFTVPNVCVVDPCESHSSVQKAMADVLAFRPEPEEIHERDLERNLPSYHFPD